jgi:hypothetical protein
MFTGKNGFLWNVVMLWRRTKRWISRSMNSGLFLMPANAARSNAVAESPESLFGDVLKPFSTASTHRVISAVSFGARSGSLFENVIGYSPLNGGL